MVVGASWTLWLTTTALLALLVPLLPAIPAGGVLVGVGAMSGAIMVMAGMHGRLGARRPWLLLALGQAAFVGGDVVFEYYEFFGRDPFPSAADVLYLAGYPVLALGLWYLLRARDPGRDRGTLLDALIMTVGGALVTWVFLVVPLVRDPSLGLVGRMVAAAYPVGDLLLLALLIRIMLTPGGRSPASRLLAAGYTVMLGADVAFAVGALTGVALERLADAAFVVAYSLVAGAVLHPSGTTVAQPTRRQAMGLSRGRLVSLTVASLLTPAATAFGALSREAANSLLIAVASGALAVLVMLRLSGLVRQVEQQAAAMSALARVDGLTGVFNRRAWDEELPAMLAQAARQGTRVAVALLDLDRFKRFNDEHGHVAGDGLLRRAAAGWRVRLRTTDVLARYGGEEFGVIMPGCTDEQAAAVVEQLRAATPEGQTCSAGVAEWDGHESSEQFVRRADRALYAAKTAGRNRLAVAAVGLDEATSPGFVIAAAPYSPRHMPEEDPATTEGTHAAVS
jgi:diguanylate cyclase (GGDEF)-like protein